MIVIGTATTNTKRVIFGNEEYNKVCLGTDIVWQKATPNQIFYTSTDGNIVTPDPTAFTVSIVSNTYSSLTGGCITFDGEVEIIGRAAFAQSYTLQTVRMPLNLSEIGMEAFIECTALTEVALNDSLYYINNFVFSDCGLESISIPDSVISIGYGAFENCTNLTKVKYTSGYGTVPAHAFYNCSSLTSITLNGVTQIKDNAFEGCALTSAVLPSIIEIGENAFYANQLSTVILGGNCRVISTKAFANCERLTTVQSTPATPPTATSDMFENTSIQNIYVPNGSADAYKAAPGWITYAEKIR